MATIEFECGSKNVRGWVSTAMHLIKTDRVQVTLKSVEEKKKEE